MFLRLPVFVLALLLSGRSFAAPVVDVLSPVVASTSPETFIVELEVGPRASDEAAISRAQQLFVGALRAWGHGTVGRTYRHLPYVTVRSPQTDAREALSKLPGVRRVHEREWYRPLADDASLELIRQPAAIGRGVTGRGTAVAVIDTGADHTHPDLGACTAPGEGCRVVLSEDVTAQDDGQLDNPLRHGTNVAAILAAVAPETSLLVFDVFEGTSDGGPLDVILVALDRVLELRNEYGIVAVNISIGGAVSKGFCSESSLTAAVEAVRAAGISVVAGSGNDGSRTGITEPACIPGVLSVGNVYGSDVGSQRKAGCEDLWTGPDVVTCSSNASPVLALLAPGGRVTAGGVTLSGTSQASPHVAGAVALMRSETPDQPLDELESRLLVSGRPVADARNDAVFPRLDIDAALDASPDTDGPAGALVINGGQAWTHPGATLGVGVEARDPSGAITMCVADDGSCDDFVPLRQTLNRDVPEGVDEMRMSVRLRDRWGNESGPFQGRIQVDGVAPTDAKVTSRLQGTTAILTGRGASDDRSGLDGFMVTEGEGRAPPEGCLYAVGVAYGAGTATVARIEELAPGSRHFFRYCTTDRAGNRSPGVAVTVDVPVDARPDGAGAAGDDAGAEGCGCSGASTGLLALAGIGLRRRRAR
jgi:subtilisin family serine protease